MRELTRERDQARQELHLALRGPRAVGDDSEGRCFICRKRREQVEFMLETSRPYFRLFICNRCWSEGAEQCNQIIAEKRQRSGM
jgi:hypothetical protein